MDVETIEAYSEIVGVECEMMRFIRLRSILYNSLHLDKSADEGSIVF